MVIPIILAKDLEELIAKAQSAAPYTDWIQVDVADNSFVSNKTFIDFSSLAGDARWKKLVQKVSFEAHLMVNKPLDYVKALINAGFKRLIAHIECNDQREFIADAHTYECEVGLAIDTDTEYEVIEPFLEELDMVLVMTVDAGFSGQAFQPDTTEKIRQIRREYPDIPIEVDGGITPETARIAKDAGATIFGANTYIFKDPLKIKEAIAKLRSI